MSEKEILEAQVKALKEAGERQITRACVSAVEKLTELAPDMGWDSGETVADMYIREFHKALEGSDK